ncbi:MAG: cyclic nucleotide-binding domain-containing protein [Gemmatimonadota bacterium]|nr:cyclic nucleotide-binding domain-containing protein [Gemmatimonadota bacterium]
MAGPTKNETYEADQVILREDKPGDCAYIIISGEVEVTKRIEGQKVVLVRLGPGGIFGEMSLIDGSPRSATVTALEPTVLSVIDNRRFQVILNRIPPEVRPLFGSLADRLRNTNEMVSSLSQQERLIYSICSLTRLLAGSKATPRGEDGCVFDYRDLMHEVLRVLAYSQKKIEDGFRALAQAKLFEIEQGEKTGSKTLYIPDTFRFGAFVDFLSERLSSVPGFPVASRKYCSLSEKAQNILYYLKNRSSHLPRDDNGRSHYDFDQYVKESVESLKHGVKDAILRLQELAAAGAVRLDKLSPLTQGKAIVYNVADITQAQLILLMADEFEQMYTELMGKG